MKKKVLCAALAVLSFPSIYAQTGKSTWGKTNYEDAPWVKNVSRPNEITEGLQNRHLSLWSSHGRYYDARKGGWRWQRPILFGTAEDLYTQTIVLPYLIPMLEHAGAVVYTPRERDWQKNEVIVDNDSRSGCYKEESLKKKWADTSLPGFAQHYGSYNDGENPFTAGTARKVKTRKRNSKISSAVYQPTIPESGRYAVYVSYQTQKKSVDDAEYIVFHKGQETHFRVNQRMGGGTWVYLGTFDFDKGNSINNAVVLTNHSSHRGIVTTDAVRFGGGMGNIVRGGSVSGLPRFLEGARYAVQWAGAPWNVVSKSNGSNDYNDDINSRSLMTNWLAGGSCYLPDKKDGKKVPIELALAIHSDAGVKTDGSFIGTLGICTTQQGNSTLSDGLSRKASRVFAEQLVANVKKDIDRAFSVNWTTRSVWDRNYSETRIPEVPSAIIETLSHQNFPDIRLGQDPNFKFVLARSIYKTILKYEASMHGKRYTVQPLAPYNFKMDYISPRKIRLQWKATPDTGEPTAMPTSYNVYAAVGGEGFDNGVNVRNPYYETELQPGLVYHFKVTACNSGGESFPTETLSALRHDGASKTILIVNAFHRLSSPSVVNTDTEQGFDLEADPGLSYGPVAGWAGRQANFNKSQMGKEGPDALGFGGEELVGKVIAGNDFNYVKEHAEALHHAGKYNIVSCNSKAVEYGEVDLSRYVLVDLLLGNEKDDGHSLYYYKTFSPALRQQITKYLNGHGKLLVSGSYLASDMQGSDEQAWLKNNLRILYDGSNADNYNPTVSGMGMSFDVYRTINEQHYGAYTPDNILPADGAFSVLTYADGHTSAIAYKGTDNCVFALSFPFECIKDAPTRNRMMRGIIHYMMSEQ
jgi:fibronectin type III domain protein